MDLFAQNRKFWDIVPSVNIVKELHTKLRDMNKEFKLRLYIKDKAFREFRKAAYDEDNVIIIHSTLYLNA